MKKILSTAYTDTLFNLGTLLLRVTLGTMIFLHHGIPKISHFDETRRFFPDFMHLGSTGSLVMSIFAEVFAAGFLVLGLFSRIAALILVIDLMVAIALVHAHQAPVKFEIAIAFLSGFLFILLVGPGKISVDAFAGK